MEKFEIKPVQNKATHGYEISGYEEILAHIKGYAENECLKDIVIADESDEKVVKNKRAEIRKYAEQLKDARLAVNNLVLGTFNSQLKELEKTLVDADLVLKKKKDEYAAKNAEPEAPAVPMHACRALHMDVKVIAKVEEFAKKLGCVTEVA